MKKLLGISVVAMLAVSPMMASATPVPANLVEPATATDQAPAANTDHAPKYAPANIQAADASHIASTAYVKGAYNAAIAAVNKVYDTATGAAETALSNAGGNGIAWNANSEALDVDLAGKSGLTMGTGDDAGKLMVDAGDGLAINATSGALEAKLDGETLANSAGGLKVKAGGITSTELASNSVTTAAITNGNVTFEKVASSDIIASNSNDDAGIRAVSSASDSKFVTEKAVAKAVEAVSSDLSNAAGDGLSWDGTTKKFSVDYTADTGLMSNSSTKALEVKVGDGIKRGSNGIEVDLTANGGLQVDSTNKTLEVKVNTGTMEVGASGIGIKNDGVDTAQIKNSAVTTDKINDGAVTAAKLASGVISNSVSTLASGDAGYDAWNGNATVASEKAVATAVANLKTGVATTINAATIKLYTTWGDDTSTGEGSTAAGTIASSGYQGL